MTAGRLEVHGLAGWRLAGGERATRGRGRGWEGHWSELNGKGADVVVGEREETRHMHEAPSVRGKDDSPHSQNGRDHSYEEGRRKRERHKRCVPVSC